MRRPLIIIGVIVLLLVILFATNPSQDEHMQTIRERRSGVVETGMTLAAEVLGAYEYNNYGLFSTVTSGEDTISFGIAGGVYVDEDDK
jgi:hypothetical protein